MTTVFPFDPPTAPVVFQPILDGNPYRATITWGFFGQRFYLTITDLSGNPVVTEAITGSGPRRPIAALSWQAGLVTVVTTNPHNYNIGGLVELTISDASPSGYNGVFECSIEDDLTFTYPLATNPDPATTDASGTQMASALGTFSFDVNLVDGYFNTSTLIYRASLAQFETNP